MSNVSVGHDVVSYTGKEKALHGQRLSKVTWKTDKETGIKKPSVAVSLPVISEEEVVSNIAALLPHVRNYLEGIQDQIVRSRVEAGATVVSSEEISVASILNYLEESDSSGNRLTKESVAQWFTAELQDSIAVALMEKLGVSTEPTQAESDQIMKITEQYKEKLAGLAGGKTSYSPEIATSLKRALAYGSENDPMVVRFTARLDKMISAARKESLLDVL